MEQPLTNLELTIEKLVYGGDGLGRADGRVVFTPFVLPGERVVVEPASVKGGLLRARLREVLTASEARVDPPCPYFGTCGGCHLQHSSYAEQIEAKRSILRETLRRVGKIEWPAEIAVIATPASPGGIATARNSTLPGLRTARRWGTSKPNRTGSVRSRSVPSPRPA